MSKLKLPENRNFGYLDTETTGISKNDQVIDVSIVRSDGEIVFNSLVKPLVPISYRAQQVHGISEDDVRNAPLWEDIAEEFSRVVSSLDALYIYNKPFDDRMIRQTYEMSGLTPIDLNSQCAMKMCKDWIKTNSIETGGKSSLDTMCSILGIDNSDVERHRALGDCIITKRVFDAIEGTSEKFLGIGDQASPVDKANTESIGKSSAIENIKRSLDLSLTSAIRFGDWVEFLDSQGIKVEPVLANPSSPEFKAVAFRYGESRFPGSKIGRNYSASSLLKKGLSYNSREDSNLLIRLFEDGQIRSQREFVNNFVLDSSISESMSKLSSPVKSTYEIRQISKVSGKNIDILWNSHLDSSAYTQLSLDTKMPKCIQIRRISVDGFSIEPVYNSRTDRAPVRVSIIKDGTVFSSVSGERCMGRAIDGLSLDIKNALANYFRGNVDKEVMAVNQYLHDPSTGSEIGKIPRYLSSKEIDQCTMIPNLKPLDRTKDREIGVEL